MRWPFGPHSACLNTVVCPLTLSLIPRLPSPSTLAHPLTCSWIFPQPFGSGNIFIDSCYFVLIWYVFFSGQHCTIGVQYHKVIAMKVWASCFSLAPLSSMWSIMGVQVCWIINKTSNTCSKLSNVMYSGMRVFLIETFGLLLSASEQVEQITVQSSVLFDIM